MLATCPLCARDSAATKQELQELRDQNQALQEQLRKQQAVIDSLSRRLATVEEGNSKTGYEAKSPQPASTEPPAQTSSGFSMKNVNLSGEGGVAFFHGGSESLFPNSEFRVDEAKLFVESPIFENVYFFTELNLMTREARDLSLQLGECYIDFENVSRLWNQDRVLNLRIGRMDIPFGEEYQTRDAIDNPLISHSLSDLWGVDEGLELYGRIGKFNYVMAVQNGGASGVRDFDADKSVVGRLGYDAANWLHLSASAMRTGDLKEPGDYWSELWFANGWIVPYSTNVTKYHANLVEGDLEFRLPRGHLKGFGGYIRYDDNDPFADNGRNIFYYSIEAVHSIIGRLYAAARFSQIFADKGYPIAGHGNPADYLRVPSEQLWRLSLGLGYRWNDNLVLKGEYAFERGKELGGESRNHEDLFSLEAAFRF